MVSKHNLALLLASLPFGWSQVSVTVCFNCCGKLSLIPVLALDMGNQVNTLQSACQSGCFAGCLGKDPDYCGLGEQFVDFSVGSIDIADQDHFILCENSEVSELASPTVSPTLYPTPFPAETLLPTFSPTKNPAVPTPLPTVFPTSSPVEQQTPTQQTTRPPTPKTTTNSTGSDDDGKSGLLVRLGDMNWKVIGPAAIIGIVLATAMVVALVRNRKPSRYNRNRFISQGNNKTTAAVGGYRNQNNPHLSASSANPIYATNLGKPSPGLSSALWIDKIKGEDENSTEKKRPKSFFTNLFARRGSKPKVGDKDDTNELGSDTSKRSSARVPDSLAPLPPSHPEPISTTSSSSKANYLTQAVGGQTLNSSDPGIDTLLRSDARNSAKMEGKPKLPGLDTLLRDSPPSSKPKAQQGIDTLVRPSIKYVSEEGKKLIEEPKELSYNALDDEL